MLRRFARAGALFVLAALPVAQTQAQTYTSLVPGRTGAELRDSLRLRFVPATTYTYDRARDTLFAFVDDGNRRLVTDLYVGRVIDIPVGADPTTAACNGDKDNSSSSCSNSRTINAEHVWPQSFGAGAVPQRSDMHHLFPARGDVNSVRNNNPFGQFPYTSAASLYRDTLTFTPASLGAGIADSLTYSAFRSGVFMPRALVRGDVARSLFYFRTVYADTATARPERIAFFEGMKATLLAWHRADPPSADEQARSRRVAIYQGRDNPFVLDTSLVARAYFDGTGGAQTAVLAFATRQGTAAEGGSALVRVRVSTSDGLPLAMAARATLALAPSTVASVADFAALPTGVDFAAGAASGSTATLDIRPLDDGPGEGTEQAVFALRTGTGGAIGADSTFTLAVFEAGAAGTGTDLFISEYVEGTSNNKAVELFNASSRSIDLAAEAYVVQFTFNGGATPATTISLTGTVARGQTFVLANSSASPDILAVAQQSTGGAWFNGNDAVVLRKGGATGTLLDVLGQVGMDPGVEWGTGLASTSDNTLRRRSEIVRGDTEPGDAFDPAREYEGFATNTFGGLGSHVYGGSFVDAERTPGALVVAVRIYPNPARGWARIDGLTAAADVVDMLGRVVGRAVPGEMLSVEGWAPGVYVVLGPRPQTFLVAR